MNPYGNVEAMLNAAVAALKANRKLEARQLLEQVINIDERNEQAWLWLSGCVDSLEDQELCLQNVLDINPNNQKARKGLEMLQRHRPPAAPDPFAGSPFGGPTKPQQADPFAGSPFGTPSAAPQADPFAGSPFGGPAPSSSSVEWGGGAPAHGSGKQVPQPSDAELDDWVAGLQIGGRDAPEVGAGPFSAGADAFGMSSSSSGQPKVLPFDGDIDWDSFGAAAPAVIPEPETQNNPFSFRDTFTPPAPASRAAEYGDFGHQDLGDFNTGLASDDAFPADSTEDASLVEGTYDDSFAQDFTGYSSAPRSGYNETQFASQSEQDDFNDEYEVNAAQDALNELNDADLLPSDEDIFSTSEFTKPASRPKVPNLTGRGRGAFRGVGATSQMSALNPFEMIPTEIQASAGGMAAEQRQLTLTVGVLGVLNVVSLVVLILNLIY